MSNFVSAVLFGKFCIFYKDNEGIFKWVNLFRLMTLNLNRYIYITNTIWMWTNPLIVIRSGTFVGLNEFGK